MKADGARCGRQMDCGVLNGEDRSVGMERAMEMDAESQMDECEGVEIDVGSGGEGVVPWSEG